MVVVEASNHGKCCHLCFDIIVTLYTINYCLWTTVYSSGSNDSVLPTLCTAATQSINSSHDCCCCCCQISIPAASFSLDPERWICNQFDKKILIIRDSFKNTVCNLYSILIASSTSLDALSNGVTKSYMSH